MEAGNRGSTPSAAGAKRGVVVRRSWRRYGGRHIELARAASNPHPPWQAEGRFQAGCKVWRRDNRASSSCSAGEGAARGAARQTARYRQKRPVRRWQDPLKIP